MKAVVTGANGFIGSSLIKKLLADDFEIYAIDLSFSNRKLTKSEKVIEIEMSLNEIEELEKLLPINSIDLFYHLAWRGVNGPEKADPSIQIQNIDMTLKCAKLAKSIGVKKFLCAGTIAEQSVLSLPFLTKTSDGMIYASAKKATQLILETYCKNVNLDFVWMQFSNIYGPNNKTGNLVSYTLGELFADKEAIFGPANQLYDFVFIDDLIEAIYKLGINKTNENFYYIGSGEPRLLKEYLVYIGTVLNKKDKVIIGKRSDDGIKYSSEMFDNRNLVRDIGEYITKTFEEGIRYTIEKY